MRVTLLVTCVVDLLEPEVGEATVRVLRAGGCEVGVALDQTCCGQPAWNAGHADEAARVARTTLRALEDQLLAGAELVVVPSGSCATMVRRSWPDLFERVGDPSTAARARWVADRTRELSELVDELDLPPLVTARIRVAQHHSCHLLRELGVRDQPERVLDRVDGVVRVAWAGDDRCCGFGGMFSVKLPELASAMADEKLVALAAAQVDEVVGCDASCLAHLRARAEGVGAPIRTRHLAQVLDDALGGDR